MFKKPMYVNGILTTTQFQDYWDIGSITYTIANVICAALGITRRVASFNADTQVFTFNKNATSVSVSSTEIRINDVLHLSTGFVLLDNGHKVIPLNSLVAAFGGTYAETATEITITYP